MPTKETGPLSWATAKKVLSQDDVQRLACAFLASEDVYKFDHHKAASEFGASKPDSFKRQIWVITKKIREAQGTDNGSEDDIPVKGKTTAPKKRKVNDEHADAAPVAKKKAGRRGEKKALAELEAEADVKVEEDKED